MTPPCPNARRRSAPPAYCYRAYAGSGGPVAGAKDDHPHPAPAGLVCCNDDLNEGPMAQDLPLDELTVAVARIQGLLVTQEKVATGTEGTADGLRP